MADEEPNFEPNFILSRTDLDAAKSMAQWGEAVISKAEGSSSLASQTRAELARTFFLELENEIRRLKEEGLHQSQKLEAIALLAGGIAHDMNNLLGAVMGHAGLAKIILGEDHPAFKHVEVSQQATKRLRDLTTQLLAFSREQASKSELTSTAFCLQDFESMLQKIMQEMRFKNIGLFVHSGDNLDSIEINLKQLHRVFLDLFINAKDAMPDGGKLRVSVSNVNLTDDDLDGLKNAKAGRHLQISVQDTGCGIPSEEIDSIFDPFFTTKGDRGTGLGLANVRSEIQKSGGDIKVESKVGEGATFTMIFPAKV